MELQQKAQEKQMIDRKLRSLVSVVSTSLDSATEEDILKARQERRDKKKIKQEKVKEIRSLTNRKETHNSSIYLPHVR